METACPKCRHEVRVPVEEIGRMLVCKFCGHNFRVRDYVLTQCPSCQSSLKVRKEYLGQPVGCRHCQHKFIARVPDQPGKPSRPSKQPSGETVWPVGSDSPGGPEADLVGEVSSAWDEHVTDKEGDTPPGQLVESRDELARLHGQVQDLQAQLESALEWRRRAEAAENQREAASAELAGLRDHLKALQGRADEAASLEAALQASGADLGRLRAELEEARGLFDREREDLAREVEAARAQRDAMKDSLEEARSRQGAGRDETEAEQGGPEGLASQLEVIQLERERLQQQLDESTEHVEVLTTERDDLRHSLAEAKVQADTLAAERAAQEQVWAEASALREASISELTECWDAELRTMQAELEAGRGALGREAEARASDEQIWGQRLDDAREQFERDLEALRQAADGLKADLVEAERRAADAIAQRDAARADADRALTEVRGREADQREMREQWEGERLAMARESDRLLGEERARGVAEQQQWRDQVDAARREFDRERASLMDRADQLGREADEARRRWDNALQRADEGERERGRLADRLGAAEAARQEAEGTWQAEVDRLSQALDLARQAEAEAARRAEALAERVQAIAEDREREQAEVEEERRAYQRNLAALEQELEALRARPEARAVSEAEPAELERRLAEVLGQHRVTTERADRLDVELRAARSQIISLNRELAVAHIYGEDHNEDDEQAPNANTEALTAAQRRFEQLSEQLKHATQENQSLRAFLAGLGITPN